MILLIISSALLALFISIICFSCTIQIERVKKQQMGWISGKTKYLDEELEKSFYQRYIYPSIHKLQKNINKSKSVKKSSAGSARL